MLKVGYIGLGLMGKSIARNILKAGFPLVVHNRSRAAVPWLKPASRHCSNGAADGGVPAAPKRLACVSSHHVTGTETSTSGSPKASQPRNSTFTPSVLSISAAAI